MNDISAASPNPERFIRRSQLYRWHLKNNAEFDTADGSVTHYADLAKESESVGQLGLADLSNLPRTVSRDRVQRNGYWVMVLHYQKPRISLMHTRTQACWCASRIKNYWSYQI